MYIRLPIFDQVRQLRLEKGLRIRQTTRNCVARSIKRTTTQFYPYHCSSSYLRIRTYIVILRGGIFHDESSKSRRKFPEIRIRIKLFLFISPLLLNGYFFANKEYSEVFLASRIIIFPSLSINFLGQAPFL